MPQKIRNSSSSIAYLNLFENMHLNSCRNFVHINHVRICINYEKKTMDFEVWVRYHQVKYSFTIVLHTYFT